MARPDGWMGPPDGAEPELTLEWIESGGPPVRAPERRGFGTGLTARWVLGKPALDHWDRNAPLPESDDRRIPWEEAQATVLDAYAAFSPDLAAEGRRFFENAWIDAPLGGGDGTGTGSGAIALSLALEGECFERVVATDLSQDALALAEENRAACGASVEFRHGESYAPLAGERFDVIVSNPPYIGEGERASLEPEVVGWEPESALFSGGDGLDLIRELVRRAPEHLTVGGLLALEIGAEQGAAARELALATGAYSVVQVKSDLAGRERMLLATLG